MLLRDWRNKRGLSLLAIAEKVGAANMSVVSRWERGVHLPHRSEMVAIYLLTGGEVTPSDFYDLPALEQRASA